MITVMEANEAQEVRQRRADAMERYFPNEKCSLHIRTRHSVMRCNRSGGKAESSDCRDLTQHPEPELLLAGHIGWPHVAVVRKTSLVPFHRYIALVLVIRPNFLHASHGRFSARVHKPIPLTSFTLSS